LEKYRNLSNPPIKEVAIGLFYAESIPLEFYGELLSVYKGLEYVINEKTVINFTFNDGLSSPSIVKDGSLIHSNDKDSTIQLDKKGVIFTFKAKYDSWETTYEDVQFFLDSLNNGDLSKSLVKTISVKYLNRINFKASEYRDILSNVKFRPSNLDNDTPPQSYMTHVQRKVQDTITTNLISNLKLCGNDDQLFHLDTQISVIKETSLPLKQFADPVHFTELREIKNKLFFSCFDEKLMSKYDE